MNEERAKSGFREISIRVPSSIRVWDFYNWVEARVTTATVIVSPTGGRYFCDRSMWKQDD